MHAHIKAHTRTHAHKQEHTHMYTHTHTHTHKHTCANAHTYTQAHTHRRTSKHTRRHTHTNTHTQTQPSFQLRKGNRNVLTTDPNVSFVLLLLLLLLLLLFLLLLLLLRQSIAWNQCSRQRTEGGESSVCISVFVFWPWSENTWHRMSHAAQTTHISPRFVHAPTPTQEPTPRTATGACGGSSRSTCFVV